MNKGTRGVTFIRHHSHPRLIGPYRAPHRRELLRDLPAFIEHSLAQAVGVGDRGFAVAVHVGVLRQLVAGTDADLEAQGLPT